ncbi:uncharacterized protein LOC120502512 [Passer montanus]|uniref:uncharacterized protein LOC120502512 n=1 Tax=Passer montanus TaxID=9160 RepID=UPI0019605E0F|nr:uncharacterized protein LOC120502512 [Passer montanus]
MEIKCVALKPQEGSMIPRSGWIVKSGTDTWHLVEETLTCVDVLQVFHENLEVSSTSIKLNWTCKFPRMCHHIRARCRMEYHSSNCEAEDVKVEEKLLGQKGTFICSPLQPFTVYSVIISLLPSTILYTDLIMTKEMVPDKPENLRMDSKTGTIRWEALPSCKGEITGYQLNITTVRVEDGSYLDFSQVLLNHSVSAYAPPHQTAGSKYLVTVQGLTAAGAGAASQLEFEAYVRVSGQPPGPWPGSAVTVVVVVVLLIPLSAGVIWFMLFSSSLSFLQLNITTVRVEDGSYLDFSQVLLNHSVSAYAPPHQTAGSKYLVTVQGLTAAGAGAASQLEFEAYVRVSGQPPGPWPGSAVTVVVVVVLLIPLSAGVIWFMLFRKKKALPRNAEEDQYTDLQPYENVHGDNYCVIENFLEKDAGKCGQAGEPFPRSPLVHETQQ